MAKAIRASEQLKHQKKEVSRLGSIVRKRIERMEQAGLLSDRTNTLIKDLELSKGCFGSKGRSNSQIKLMYARYVDFLTSENSTLSSYKQTLKRLNDTLQLTESKNVREIQRAVQEFNYKVGQIQSRIKKDLGTQYDYYKTVHLAREYVQKSQKSLGEIGEIDDKLIQNLLEVEKVERGFEGYSIGNDYEWIDD